MSSNHLNGSGCLDKITWAERGAERSVERAWQKTMEQERSGRLRSGAAHSPLQP